MTSPIPNMATITASLERSLQNCSLNQQHTTSSSSSSSGGGGGGAAAAVELNSEGSSLPFHWEQCLDLKTGELYYINWRTGMRATEDPRTAAAAEYVDDCSSEEEDSSSYDSDGSSLESSPCSSREQWSDKSNQENCYYDDEERNNNNSNINSNNSNNVLVVAGCKSCLMYYMVPKQLEICPKCCGQLLHFDRSENASS
ncbi:NKAP family protein-like [Salvia splendens]|uniref:NKAP family protein-like n=1 Tax=Salvia splendens TaxID=180675 RepID=UPI001C268679|nr:NKAP family protein-like [Salvia splendens]